MIEFLKIILKKVNFKSDNEKLNKYNKIIYTIIVLSALVLIGFIIWIIVKNFPQFWEYFTYELNEAKLNFNK